MVDPNFARLIETTLTWEGGYSNNAHDPGGETKFGISKASYPNLDIKNLTKDQAIAIYEADYWLGPKINLLPPAYAGKVFDLGVNLGVGTAIQLVQTAIVILDPRSRLAIDGKLGPQTLVQAQRIGSHDMVTLLRGLARVRYLYIVTQHPERREFLDGWLRRANS